ncbi:MAG: helix-turn-helix transcriptional regulator [Ignavibacteria bacterium]|nr:helix-turn-helix transcriptional regulator [Ignavibacteria bacterium]MBL0323245.1 helix-turn-helix transcriptional regulator [Ignavibacteria bacterium]
MSKHHENLGNNIRRYRLKKGLTQEQLSQLSDVSEAYLSKLEAGRRNPTVTVLAKIAEILGVELEMLFRKV